MQTQFKIIKWAVAKCPSIKLNLVESVFSLLWQDHFNRYFGLQLGQAEGPVANAHHTFDLTSASGGAIQVSRYVKLDVKFLGLQVPRVRFLITWNPNEVLDPEHKPRLHRIVFWNLVKITYQVLCNPKFV